MRLTINKLLKIFFRTYADEKTFVIEIKDGASVAFAVTGNGVEGTEYTAKVDTINQTLIGSGTAGNEFNWYISSLEPGNYSVTLTASNDSTSDSRTINFKLYKSDNSIDYGELSELSVIGSANESKFNIDINTVLPKGNQYKIKVSEPWCSPINSPVRKTFTSGEKLYGTYQVTVETFRDGVVSADDGAIRTVKNSRPEGATLSVTANDTTTGSNVIQGNKLGEINLSAISTGITDPQYSFWRRDANGWVLIRDYNDTASAIWTSQ